MRFARAKPHGQKDSARDFILPFGKRSIQFRIRITRVVKLPLKIDLEVVRFLMSDLKKTVR